MDAHFLDSSYLFISCLMKSKRGRMFNFVNKPKIIDARWTKTINMLKIKCSCSSEFEMRADRWYTYCPKCGTKVEMKKLRDQLLEDGG